MDLKNIKTIVLLMFENRSFDHLFGWLSFDGINTGINGFKKPLKQYGNIYKGDSNYNPFRIKTDSAFSFDLPHEHDWIAQQLDRSPVNGQFQMDGFVKAYLEKTKDNPNKKSPPMGFFDQELIPISSFLANEYSVCDNWYSPLPTSTQPNRTMAFCGDSSIFETKLQLIDATGNIFDWMKNHGVKWRVYHDGLSFFVLYKDLWKYVLSDQFKDYEFLFRDFQDEADETFPEVILVEPSYQDAPHLGSDHPNDNHPPLAIGFGEEFLRRTYEAVITNPTRWGNTLMIVYYDEHGGFYDHVPPPPISYKTKGKNPFAFESLGVRIPALLISPYAPKNSVSHLQFDHTSVLQLLAEKFTPGQPFSDTVNERRNKGIHSISESLSDSPDLSAPAPPSEMLIVKSFLGDSIPIAPESEMAKSFEQAAQDLMVQEQTKTAEKYPELFQWREAVAKARAK
jgi:phospholipase C